MSSAEEREECPGAHLSARGFHHFRHCVHYLVQSRLHSFTQVDEMLFGSLHASKIFVQT